MLIKAMPPQEMHQHLQPQNPPLQSQSKHGKEVKNPPKFLQSLHEIIDQYDVFLFDLWGVVHNGKQAFEGAIEILKFLKAHGKPVYFLSNAPRRLEAAITQLVERGVAKDLYQGIWTSGEETFEHLRDRHDTYYQKLGNKLYHLGPDKDKSLYNSLPFYTPVAIEEADFILNTGTINFEDTLEDYIPILNIGIARKLPMVCANPDLVVLFGDATAICAGRIAKEYEKMGGQVHYHGKPMASIFTNFLDRLNIQNYEKVLMIGDSLRTDIKGANNAEIDSVFILSGIHQLTSEDPTLYETYDAQPTYVMMRVR